MLDDDSERLLEISQQLADIQIKMYQLQAEIHMLKLINNILEAK